MTAAAAAGAGLLLAVLASSDAQSGRRWFASPNAPEGGDGSPSNPFTRAGDAVRRAAAGDTVVLGPGHYRESLRPTAGIAIEGPSSAIFLPAGEIGILVQAPVRLVGFAVDGGEIGARIESTALLEGLILRNQRRAAVEVSPSAKARLRDCILATGHPSATGIAASPAAQVVASGLEFDGPFRFAVRGSGASMTLEDVRIAGAAVGIACVQGCRATLFRAQLHGSSPVAGPPSASAGLLAGAAQLSARDCLISGFEQCAVANAGADLRLQDCATARCALNGGFAGRASLSLVAHTHAGPSSNAAVQLVSSTAVVEGGAFHAPGPVGVAIRHGRVTISGVTIIGARQDFGGAFGDAVFAIEPESLRILGSSLEQNEGTAVTVLGGSTRLLGLEARANGLAAVAAHRGARVRMEGCLVAGPDPVVAVEGSKVVPFPAIAP